MCRRAFFFREKNSLSTYFSVLQNICDAKDVSDYGARVRDFGTLINPALENPCRRLALFNHDRKISDHLKKFTRRESTRERRVGQGLMVPMIQQRPSQTKRKEHDRRVINLAAATHKAPVDYYHRAVVMRLPDAADAGLIFGR